MKGKAIGGDHVGSILAVFSNPTLAHEGRLGAVEASNILLPEKHRKEKLFTKN